MIDLFWIVFYFAIGHMFIWIQNHGQFLFDSWKDNIWPALLLSPFPAYCFITATKKAFPYYGNLWGARLTGFSTGIIIFTFLTYMIFAEGITFKTAICLLLSMAIILIQVFL
jgi:hypothetical protein